MKFITSLLFKFSRWWKYLFFCGLFLLIGNSVLAYEQNFDSFSSGNNVSVYSDWYGDGILTSSKYYSSPNSVYGTSSFSYIPASSTDISIFSFYYLINTDNIENLVLFRNSDLPTNIFGLDLSTGSTYYNVRLIYLDGSSFNLKGKSSVSKDTWYKIEVIYDKNTASTTVIWNNTDETTQIAQNSMKLNQITFTPHYSGIGTINDLLIDDFYYYEDYLDDILFINPENSSIQTVNDFFWEYNYKISTIDYWTTYEFLNVDLGFFHYTNGIVDATTTLSVLREPMDTIVPNTYYNEQITDPASFPSQLGSYQAVILLKGVYSDGSSDTLSSDTLTFGIATTTAINPTAWCTGLCNDIATATDWIGQIGNGVNCAFRSATCYIFSPHQYNLDQFYTQYNNFKLVFPFNTFFDLASTTENAFASSTINNDQTFGLPNIRQTGTTTEFYIQTLLSSSTMSSFIGQENATLFRNVISSLLYGITAGIILLIIW